MDEKMFCFQCEQAANGCACVGNAGVCGKSAETADAQDALTGALIGFAELLVELGQPIQPPQALLLLEGLFTTITNVNFDPETVRQLTEKVWEAKNAAFATACPAPAPVGDYDMKQLWQEPDEDIRSLKSTVLFGLRGMAAYTYHARVLGYTDGEIDTFFCTALSTLAHEQDKEKLFQLVQETGLMAYRVMELLDKANTTTFGDPEPVEVPLTIQKGPFIVISGHDLYDMKCLLEQTAGKGISIYTHSEMLPAHGYPELKQKYPHLKGNFGTAWQNQQREFEDIPAPILFTTNCIMPLRPSYADRVFTTSVVSYPGIVHIGESRDFSPVIAKALELGGYEKDTLVPGMNGGQHRCHRVCPGCSPAPRGRDRGSRQGREDPALLPGGRLRRHPPQPPLLHRVCQAHPAGHRAADPGLRQIPAQRPAAGHGARHRPATHPGRGPVQRRLQRHPDRAGAGGRLWLLGQRTAPLHHPVLV